VFPLLVYASGFPLMAVRAEQNQRASCLILIPQNPSIRAHPGSHATFSNLRPMLAAIFVLVVKLQNIPVGRTTLGALDMLGDNVIGADLGHEVSLLLPSLLTQRLDHTRATLEAADLNLAVSET
jgi:hypothetical protein